MSVPDIPTVLGFEGLASVITALNDKSKDFAVCEDVSYTRMFRYQEVMRRSLPWAIALSVTSQKNMRLKHSVAILVVAARAWETIIEYFGPEKG
jgi:hypothetical protein